MNKSKKKIALMSYAMDNRPAKGTALYTRKLLENLLDDDRFDFYLVHYEKVDDPLYEKAKEIIMPKLRLPYATHFVRQLLFFWKYRNEKFDIIHWFQPRVYPFYWLAPARKIVITAHGAGDITAPSFFNFPKLVFNFILSYLNKWVDVFIAVSDYARQEIITHYHADPNKVFVTYNGGGENFEPINKVEAKEHIKTKYKVDAPFILDVSRLQPHKNVDSLIRAYIKMRTDNQNRQEKLVIVGSPVYGYEETYALAGQSRYKDDIYFVNYVEIEDLNAMYSAAEVFVFPSLNEGFGLPVIEAMASGTPVITSNTTSLPEVAGEAAVIVDPMNIDGLAQAMYKVLSDEQFKQDLIQKGLVWSRRFTWQQTADKTKNIYLKLQ